MLVLYCPQPKTKRKLAKKQTNLSPSPSSPMRPSSPAWAVLTSIPRHDFSGCMNRPLIVPTFRGRFRSEVTVNNFHKNRVLTWVLRTLSKQVKSCDATGCKGKQFAVILQVIHLWRVNKEAWKENLLRRANNPGPNWHFTIIKHQYAFETSTRVSVQPLDQPFAVDQLYFNI